jgi:lysozyme
MKPRYQLSRKGVELIKQFEGYRRMSAQLASGGWTIGYGHTKSARQGAEVSEADAEALLVYDLIEVQGELNRLVFTPLNQNQYDALVSFAFNIGVEAFRTSGVLRRINEGALLQAAFALEMWRKSDFEGERIVLDALIRRRSAEKGLFLTPTDGFVPTPTPILPPKIDYDAAGAEPRQLPLNLVVAMDGLLAEARAEDTDMAPPPANPATLAAAEAVTERLRALVPETEGEASAPETPAQPREASPEVERDQPAQAAVDPLSAPASEMTPPPAEDEPPVLPEAAVTAPVVYEDEPQNAIQIGPMGVVRPKKKRRYRLIPYGPLILLGLVFFVGGVVWQLTKQDALGLGVALVGALAIAVGVYYLLQQIDEEPTNGES